MKVIWISNWRMYQDSTDLWPKPPIHAMRANNKKFFHGQSHMFDKMHMKAWLVLTPSIKQGISYVPYFGIYFLFPEALYTQKLSFYQLVIARPCYDINFPLSLLTHYNWVCLSVDSQYSVACLSKKTWAIPQSQNKMFQSQDRFFGVGELQPSLHVHFIKTAHGGIHQGLPDYW